MRLAPSHDFPFFPPHELRSAYRVMGVGGKLPPSFFLAALQAQDDTKQAAHCQGAKARWAGTRTLGLPFCAPNGRMDCMRMILLDGSSILRGTGRFTTHESGTSCARAAVMQPREYERTTVFCGAATWWTRGERAAGIHDHSPLAQYKASNGLPVTEKSGELLQRNAVGDHSPLLHAARLVSGIATRPGGAWSTRFAAGDSIQFSIAATCIKVWPNLAPGRESIAGPHRQSTRCTGSASRLQTSAVWNPARTGSLKVTQD